MVNLQIDGVGLSVPEGTKIMEAAREAGINIPSLCYLKGINEIGACRICCVEIKGMERLAAACSETVREGMEVFTDTPKVRRTRRGNMQLILSQHDCECTNCVRGGSCRLQELANEMNLRRLPLLRWVEDRPWNPDFPLIRDSRKCIKCMRCIQVCDHIQGLHVWDVINTGSRTTVGVRGGGRIEEAPCALCGQCIANCPTAALRERDDTEAFRAALEDERKLVAVQVAPAVRAALCESLGVEAEALPIGKILSLLKRLGADYVFDTAFSADLTVMEEVHELMSRMRTGELREMPMFTSCCPGWVRFVKARYPHLVRRLSSAKSPQQMFGAVMKSYFAERAGVRPEDMMTVSVMPCVAKKAEREAELYYGEYAGHDVDVVLTTRELARLAREARIAPAALPECEPDRLMREASGAGILFGTSGGVMEAALRTAYYLMTGENPLPDFIEYRPRPEIGDGVRDAVLSLGGITLRAAVVCGLGDAGRLIDGLERREFRYDFVEIMACPGGCAGGGGQPIREEGCAAEERGEVLRGIDRSMELRFSHENEDVQRLYRDFLEAPMSHKAHFLLHTKQT